MKKYILQTGLLLSLLLVTFSLSSCLNSGLDELESFHDAEIKNIKFEYRWERPLSDKDPTNTQMGVVSLATDIQIDGTTIYCTINVPEAGNPSMFTEAIRNQVSLAKIVGMASISTAATIKPIGNAPVLGKFGNFTNDCKYVVTAADGSTKKEWVIKCTMKK